MDAAGSILIIDDDEDFGRSLRRLLRMDGFAEVDVSASFAGAVTEGKLASYDIILLDRKLPDGTAEQILPRLKQLAFDAVVIILTGYADLESTIDVFREGAADFLMKPLNREVLRSTLRRNMLLKQSRETIRDYVKVLDHVHDAVISTTLNGTIRTWNPGAERIYGYEREEVVGRSADLLYPPEGERVFSEGVIPTLAKVDYHDVELLARRKGGAEVHVALRLAGQRDVDGNLQGIIACSNDTTERYRLQKRLLQISEDEKRRIGQDLHDDLCQQLGGIACVAKVVQETMRDNDPETARTIGEVVSMINEANTHARAIARGFMPVALESGGLVQALQELVTTTEKLFGIRCSLESAEPLELPSAVSVQIFRIVQESISNAVKHGKADKVEIRVSAEGANRVFTICDDGVGIPDEAESADGMGLVTMGLRATVMGGELKISKNQPRGTKVECTVPAGHEP